MDDYIAFTNKFKKTFLPLNSPDVEEAYLDFYNVIKKAPKKSLPRSYRNNGIPCWASAECETLYTSILQSLEMRHDSSLAATVSLSDLKVNSSSNLKGAQCAVPRWITDQEPEQINI